MSRYAGILWPIEPQSFLTASLAAHLLAHRSGLAAAVSLLAVGVDALGKPRMAL